MTTGLQLSSRSIPRRSSAVKVAFGTWTTAVSARARQLDDERRALARHALDGYVPTGGARERAADGESEPDAITSGGTLAQLSERLEDAALHLDRDSGAGVLHAQAHQVGGRHVGRQRHVPA